jgi:exonuclease III
LTTFSERDSDESIRLISWNVAGRVRKLPRQVEGLMDHVPDVLALQEVTATTLPLWRSELESRQYHVLTSFDLTENRSELVGGRKYCVLLASRWPAQTLPPSEFSVPWPERVVSAVIDAPWGEIECHNAHLPAGVSHGYIKVETFEGIHERLSRPSGRSRILCGDFNSPQSEREDGTTIPFGSGNARWSSAELSVVRGLAEHDLTDVFRMLHGFHKQEMSWVMKRKGKTYGRHFDHVFASRSLLPVGCGYLHPLREQGLSDHSPIEARFDPKQDQI